MINTEGFKKWLSENTEYSFQVTGDLLSRIKRADSILEWKDDETYLFYLEKEPRFLELSVSVKSQLRRAVHLYETYVKENCGENNG